LPQRSGLMYSFFYFCWVKIIFVFRISKNNIKVGKF
jgi:hypothetical protein